MQKNVKVTYCVLDKNSQHIIYILKEQLDSRHLSITGEHIRILKEKYINGILIMKLD